MESVNLHRESPLTRVRGPGVERLVVATARECAYIMRIFVETKMRKLALNAIRQPANLSIDSKLLKEAKGLDVNVSRAAEAGIAEAVATEKTRLWKLENRATIEAWNEYVEKHGIPLEEHRQF